MELDVVFILSGNFGGDSEAFGDFTGFEIGASEIETAERGGRKDALKVRNRLGRKMIGEQNQS
jgi:hypothetical protein